MTTLSVIITTHNRLPLLKDAVASVRRHRDPDWQLVVVDDASEDDTPEWLSGLSEPWIEVVSNEQNLERSASRNAGLAAADGDFVLFLDDDDRIAPGLKKLAADLAARPRVVAGVGRYFGFDESGHGRNSRRPTLPYTGTLWPSVLAGWPLCGGQMLFRRDVVESAGGWDASIVTGEDVDLFLRTSLRGPVVVRSHVIIERRMHAEQWHTKRGALYHESRRSYRERFVSALPDQQRALGDACFHAWEQRGLARRAYLERRPRDAFRAQVAAVRAAPRAAFARLNAMHTMRDLTSSFVGTILGGRVFAGVGRLRQALRVRFGRAPERHKQRHTGENDRPE